MTQKEMMAQMQAMMAQMQALVQENTQLKANAGKVRTIPEITIEGQIADGHVLLKMPELRERYESDKGKSGVTLCTTGFNKKLPVKGIPGAYAVVRVYIPD